MHGLEIDYAGIRWGYAFIKAPGKLPEEDRYHILVNAIEMYLKEEEERDVEGEAFEGRLQNTKETVQLGAFTGCKFKAKLDTNRGGRSDLSFLVTEYNNPALN